MLRISSLIKTFPGERLRRRNRGTSEGSARVRAIDDVSFTVEEGELFTLLGPSGCGKTTTLRAIAGLETPDSGSIVLGERVLFDGGRGVRVPANRRRLGMVFQSYAIWPHMTVFENVVFPLKALPRSKRPSSAERSEAVERVLDLMHLGGYASRPATKLSGGQQQRLALARALVVRPDVLLLDEPLSNLDAKLRESLRLELKRLQRETGQTSVYVTHDQGEALALSSRIAVMNGGNIMQIDKPRSIYDKPGNAFVAEFIGTSNFLSGEVAGVNAVHLEIKTECGLIVAGVPSDGEVFRAGGEVTIAIRPEAFQLHEELPVAPTGHLEGVVRTRAFLGDAIDHVVEVGSQELQVRCNPAISVEPGRTVFLTAEPSRVRVIPR